MTSATSDLAPAALLAALHTRRLGRPYEFLPSCASTNDHVATRAAEGAPEGLLVAADEQTRGRGRRGRAWHSPKGSNLYLSLLLRPALSAAETAPLALLAGAALAEALAGLDFSPRLKWPNDVLLDTDTGLRKVAGILAEMASVGGRARHVVLGVGCNVNPLTFPEALAAVATSLRLVGGREIHRGTLLAAFLHAFETIYEGFLADGPGPGLARWRRYALLDRPCRIQHETAALVGIAAGIDDAGALLLRTAGGETVRVNGGEVSWL